MSTRIFVNLHRPEYEVGQLDRDGSPKHAAIHRTPDRREMHDAFAAARRRAVALRSARRPLSLDVR